MFCINCGQKLEEGMRFCIYCGTRQEEPVNDIEIEELTANPAEPLESTCLLVLQDAADDDRVYSAEIQMPVVVGREAGACTMLIENDKSVSRRHCEFFLEDGVCYVKDLGSFNGTVLNGEKITKASAVKVGDTLKIGGRKLTVVQCDIA